MGTYLDQAINGATADSTAADLVPVSPFLSLHAHFGMLLGVAELDLLSSYPRGKSRLHNAWLHGAGVVWGYRVSIGEVAGDSETAGLSPQTLRVGPGLALDDVGHELLLDRAHCLDLEAWFKDHKQEVLEAGAVTEPEDGGTLTFAAHVLARLRPCLTRPVPAIAEPCSENQSQTAFSRVAEQVELVLEPVPASAAALPPLPFHRLRVLFGLEAPTLPADQPVVDERAAVLAKAPADQPMAYLQAFRRLAALDTVDRQPFVQSGGIPSLFPGDEKESAVLLAAVTAITLERQGDAYTLADSAPVVDVTVRPTLVPTATIQELLNGPLCVCAEGTPAPLSPTPGGATQPDGPRLVPGSLALDKKVLKLEADMPLHGMTVTPDAFLVGAFTDEDGWTEVEVGQADLDASGTTVSLELTKTVSKARLLRVTARGTGAEPLLGQNLRPLGACDATPGGADLVVMMERS